MEKSYLSRQAKNFFCCLNHFFIGWNNFSAKIKEFLVLCFVWNAMISTTCSLKWVNELQHEILSQLIIRSTLGITRVNKKTFCVADVLQRQMCRKTILRLQLSKKSEIEFFSDNIPVFSIKILTKIYWSIIVITDTRPR